MSQHPNAALAHRAWDAVSRADAEALCDVLASDVVWHATGSTPWQGEHRGIDAVLDYLARVGELTDVFDASLIDVLSSEERVLIVFHVELHRDDRRVDVPYLLLARIGDGRAVEVWTCPLSPDALARFWTG